MNFTLCATVDCPRRATTRGWCNTCYRRWTRGLPERPPPEPTGNAIVCPDDYLDTVRQAVELDAKPLFAVLWRLLGEAAWAGAPLEQYLKTRKDEAC